MSAPFAVASVQTAAGPSAALRVDDRLHLLGSLEPSLAQHSVRTLLNDWFDYLPRLSAAADRAHNQGGDVEPVGDHALLSPNLYPDKLLAVGANYSGHLDEMGQPGVRSESMPFFLRPPTTSLVGPGKTVRKPRSSKKFDWECELTVFVGRRLRNATRLESADAVAGYAIGLDLSCRDLIPTKNELKIDLARGKAQDTMAPCGPWLTPAAFVTEVNDLLVQLWVNDEQMMNASTSEMLYQVDEQLSLISEYIGLVPGDMLFTGSPSGSAAQHNNRWLEPGDRIRASIGNLGVLDVEITD